MVRYKAVGKIAFAPEHHRRGNLDKLSQRTQKIPDPTGKPPAILVRASVRLKFCASVRTRRIELEKLHATVELKTVNIIRKKIRRHGAS